MNSTLSSYNSDVTNEDIQIVYTPNNQVKNYEYTIYRNNRKYKIVTIPNSQISNILLTESGTYQIKIKEYYENEEKQIESGNYLIDKEAPSLEVGNQNLTLKKGINIDIMGNVKAKDNFDGDLTKSVTTNADKIDFSKIGNHKLVYSVSDKAGNITTKTVMVNVVKNNTTQLLITQSFILLTLIILLIYVIRYNRSLTIEKRISKYSIKPIKDHSKSLFGGIFRFVDKLLTKISKTLSKSVILTKISKRYEKYIKVFGKENETGITIIAEKIIVSFIFLLVAIISKTIRLQVLSFYEMIIPLLVGYYALDFIYLYRYNKYRKKLENDFLQAIIVMNNAFKSGRSITQAVELVSTELKGPISEEFKKISLELSFGLDVEVVFKRFADRIGLEEAAYLTASLAITNKTGGNIIRVFDSIEKTLFNRKKLRLELNSLTSSSKLIMYVVIFVPILFVAVISIINPSYFLPLFSSPLGLILMGIMIIIYITYIIIVRRIVNIRT